MIFVTVGTHEQPFDRLLQCVGGLKDSRVIQEEIVMQTGFSMYQSSQCRCFPFLSYQEMLKNVKEARIVITHGGPSSFIMPLQMGKIPIVVPRRKQFNEHVNDHQLEFTRMIAQRQKNIIPVYNMEDLPDVIRNYDRIVQNAEGNFSGNNRKFNEDFEKLVDEILK